MDLSQIPAHFRRLVCIREGYRCARCAAPIPNKHHWHHRRTRSVRDEHRHCACVGVLVCPTCHAWIHAHPMEAAATGFIVSRHQTEPWTVPFRKPGPIPGWTLPDCQGKTRTTIAPTIGEAIERFTQDE